MTTTPPLVRGHVLSWDEAGQQRTLDINDVLDWFEWLDRHSGFAFEPEGPGEGYTARRELVRGKPVWFAYRQSGGATSRVELGARQQLTASRLRDAVMLLDFAPQSSDPARIVSIRLEAASREDLHEALRQLPQLIMEPPERQQQGWVAQGRLELAPAASARETGSAQCTSCGQPAVAGSYLCETCMVSLSGLE